MSYTHPDFKIIEKLFGVNKWLHPRLESFNIDISTAVEHHLSDSVELKDVDLDRIKNLVIHSKTVILNDLAKRVFMDTLNVLNASYADYISEYTGVDFMGQPVKAMYGPNVLIKTETVYRLSENVFSGINGGYRLLSMHDLLCKAISEWTEHCYIVDDLPTFKLLPFIFSYEIEDFAEDELVDHKILNKAMAAFDREELKEHILQKIEENPSTKGKELIKRFETIIDIANGVISSNVGRIENLKNELPSQIEACFKQRKEDEAIKKGLSDIGIPTDGWSRNWQMRATVLSDIDRRLKDEFPEDNAIKSDRLLGDISYHTNSLKKSFIYHFLRCNLYLKSASEIEENANLLIDKIRYLTDEQTLTLNQFKRLTNLFYDNFGFRLSTVEPTVYRLYEDGTTEELNEISDIISKVFRDRYSLSDADIDTILDVYSKDGIVGTFPEEKKQVEALHVDSCISKFV